MISIDILTYASNYSYQVFERFCGSLNDTGFGGKIYIIIKPCDLDIINLLKSKYNNVIELIDDETHITAVHNHRFFVKKKYLDMGIFTSELLLLCDFRDVLFQKNIEEYNYDSNIELYGFLEGIKINQDMNCNTPWMKRIECILEEQFYDEIADKRVICSGTTIGTVNGIKKYLDSLCGIINNYNITEILDQGIHNYLIHLNKIENIKIKLLSNDDNLVNTVGCDVHIVNNDNKITNKNNEVSFIVHQYDRFSLDKLQQISSKYDFMLNL